MENIKSILKVIGLAFAALFLIGLFMGGENAVVIISENEIQNWPFKAKSGAFKCHNESAYFVVNNVYYAFTGKGLRDHRKPKNTDVRIIRWQQKPDEDLLRDFEKAGMDISSAEFKSTWTSGYPLTPIPDQISKMVKKCQG